MNAGQVANSSWPAFSISRVASRVGTMPYTDIEDARRNSREWYRANRERVLSRLRARTPEERAQVEERRRARRAADPAVGAREYESSRRWRSNPENREKARLTARAYDASPKGRATRRTIRLRSYFNITPEQYDAMLQMQNGVCAICKLPETARHRGRGAVIALAVDHDHRCCSGKTSCGKCIRGLLCDRCNFKRWPDDPALLRAAADYFERYNERSN